MLQVDSQRTVAILLHVWQHRRVDQVTVDRIFDQQLTVAVVHGDRPERLDRRQRTGGEGECVVVLAAIQDLALGIDTGQQVHRLGGVVAVDPGPAAAGTLEPVAVVEIAVAP